MSSHESDDGERAEAPAEVSTEVTGEVPRRGLLAGAGLAGAGLAGAGLGVGLAAGAAGGWFAHARQSDEPGASDADASMHSPFGAHQAGIVTPTPAATELIAFDLRPGIAGAGLQKLLKLWSADIERLMQAKAPLGDVTPEMAQANTRLTITLGVGPRVFSLTGVTCPRPTGLIDVPAMTHDRLDARWSGGDLLLMVAADDATTVAHAVRRLTVDAATFAMVRWVQTGSWRGTDHAGARVTGRNLFGQIDGTANPSGDTLATTVWSDEGSWAGGSQLVVRRIEMNLDTWDRLTRSQQETSIGRDLAHGAPLTGGVEHDDLDLTARDENGLVIAVNAHSRLAHPTQNRGRRMLRRGLNYTHAETVNGTHRTSSGLVFLAFQRSIAEQFVPVQTKLDAGDALNEWTTAIGSAVFAILPGRERDDWLGHQLFA